MPTERPDLPSLDDALAQGIPDNATFPITETPPPGYMTDENEPVSPSSSAGTKTFVSCKNIQIAMSYRDNNIYQKYL